MAFFWFILQSLVLLCAAVWAEPPTNSYLPPLSGGHSHHVSSGLSLGLGSGYHAVSGGFQESEGAHLDPQLLRKIEEILLAQENQGGHGHGSHGM